MAGHRDYGLVFFAVLLGVGCTNDYDAFDLAGGLVDGSAEADGGRADGPIDASLEATGDTVHSDSLGPDVRADAPAEAQADRPTLTDVLESAAETLVPPDSADVVIVQDALEEPVEDSSTPPDVGPCGANGKLCSNVCFSATNPLVGCADPNCLACDLANATAGCSDGECSISVCTPWYGDCNNKPSDGCEAYLAGDDKNCSECGKACPSGLSCQAGQCHCAYDEDCSIGAPGTCQFSGKCKCGNKNCSQFGDRCVAQNTCG